jgi:hypothetical protein
MSALTMLPSLKQYLGITSDGSDAVLTQMIAAASAAVENFVGYPLESATRTQRLDGNGADIIHPPARPITDVSAVVVDGREFLPATSLHSVGFEFDYRAVWLRGGERFRLGRRNVSITYTAGYDTIPADIAQAVNELIGLRYRERDWIGFVSKSLAGETVTFNTAALPKSTLAVLGQYQRVTP